VLEFAEGNTQFAVQLLGTASHPSDMPTPNLNELPRERLRRLKLVDDSPSIVADDYVQVDRPRSRVVKSHETHLMNDAVDFRRAKEVEFFSTAKHPPVAFDFVVKRGSERQITLVRRELTTMVRGRLVKLLHRLGPNHVGVRVWPIGFEKNWMWEKEWVLQDDPHDPTPNVEPVSTASSVAAGVSSPTTTRPLTQRELF
jgi:hypothetical protein